MGHIRKNDQVYITTGKDKGKMGKVIRVFPQEERVIVENINIMKKAKRRTQQNQQGGFVEIESAIHVSNVMLFDKKAGKPTRVTFKVGKDGKKQRLSKKTGEVI